MCFGQTIDQGIELVPGARECEPLGGGRGAGVGAASTAAPAQYTYKVLKNPNDQAGLLRLQSTGRIDVPGRDTKRTLTVDLTKKSLLDYIYYTDFETVDPQYYIRDAAGRQTRENSSTRSRPPGGP